MKEDPDFNNELNKIVSSPFVSAATRKVLLERMNTDTSQYLFFNSLEIATLISVCERLLDEKSAVVEFVVHSIDKRLHEKAGNGWRYSALPCDEQAYSIGLKAINAVSFENCRQNFTKLDDLQKDFILRLLQQGGALPIEFKEFSWPLFFEEMLAEVCEFFYSHPLTSIEMGYAGMKDVNGWAVGS